MKLDTVQKQIIKDIPSIKPWFFSHCGEEADSVMKTLNLPVKDCKVSNSFADSFSREVVQRMYCLLSCGLKCLRNQEYHKI